MANVFTLEMATPEKLFYEGEAEILILRTLSGEEGFMAGHAWACKLLDIGEMWFKEPGAKDYKYAALSGGFIDVKDRILVYADAAEWPEDIDVKRAEIAAERETAWLAEHGSGKGAEGLDPDEIGGHRQSLRRAKNRLKVASGSTFRR